PLLEGERLAEFRKLVGEIAHEADRIGFAEQRRHLADDDGAGTERLDDEAELGELARAGDETRSVGLVELDHLGEEEELALDAAIAEMLLHPLVDEALMRGVLVDDD